LTLTPQLSSGDSSVTERPRFDSSGRRLFGREAEIAVLDQVVARIPERGGVLVLRGDAGIGKTALLAVASAEASSRGVSVLRAVGAQSEIGMAFAGLHQLLLPVLGGLDHLPAPQRDALAAAFGTVDVPVPDPFLIALGALNLLAEAAEQVPRLLVVDQAQWLDPPTASALAFVARRVEAEPIAVLFALRSGVANAIDAAGLPELNLCGLDDEAAGELLDEQGESLPWRLRQRVLAIAAGNPLALLELPGTVRLDDARADCVDPPSASLTSTLERAFAGQEAGLPSATRDVMLLAAADERAAATEVLAAASLMGHAEVGVDAVGPAEAAALAAIVDGAISFRHPLVGSAVSTTPRALRVAARPTRRLRSCWPIPTVGCGTEQRR
jgi:hypothetical protein